MRMNDKAWLNWLFERWLVASDEAKARLHDYSYVRGHPENFDGDEDWRRSVERARQNWLAACRERDERQQAHDGYAEALVAQEEDDSGGFDSATPEQQDRWTWGTER